MGYSLGKYAITAVKCSTYLVVHSSREYLVGSFVDLVAFECKEGTLEKFTAKTWPGLPSILNRGALRTCMKS